MTHHVLKYYHREYYLHSLKCASPYMSYICHETSEKNIPWRKVAKKESKLALSVQKRQWRTQELCSGGEGTTNSVDDREKGDLGAVAPSQGFWRQL